MQIKSWRGAALPALAAAVAVVVGCGRTDNQSGPDARASGGKRGQSLARAGENPAPAGAGKEGKKGHDHSGWWCDEHGIPEAECSMCSSKVAAEFKKKGDWCDKHNRAKSQCFLCDPKLKEKYAALYRAKYGKEPPPTEEDEKK